MSDALPKEYKLHGLLRDATEAYLGDVVQPLKKLLPEYRKIEQGVMNAICTKFEISSSCPGKGCPTTILILPTPPIKSVAGNPNEGMGSGLAFCCFRDEPAYPTMIKTCVDCNLLLGGEFGKYCPKRNEVKELFKLSITRN